MAFARRFARRSLLTAAGLRPFWSFRATGGEGVSVAIIARLTELPLLPVPMLLVAARVSLPPGAEAAAVIPAGARAIAVEVGEVEVLAVGPEAAWLAPRGALGDGSSLLSTTVRAGEAVSLPATAVEGMRNHGSGAATLLDVAVLPAGGPMPPPAFISGAGVEFRLLGSGVVEAPPPLADFVLRQVDLPPAGAMPTALGSGIALLLADRGRLAVEVIRGQIDVSIAAGGIGPAGRARPVDAGEVRVLPASSAAFIAAGAAVHVRAEGPTPARVLVVSLAPSASPMDAKTDPAFGG